MKQPGESTVARWTVDQLIARCLANENTAWQEFLRRYGRLIYSALIKADLTQEEQEEAFQASVVAIYRALPRLRDRTRLLSWILSIARRQAVNCIRGKARVPRAIVTTESLAEDALERPASDPLPPEARLALERAQQAQEALAAVSERCRRLLTYLFYDEGQPGYEEISRRERIPIGSIGPTRARCLERMRRYFEDRGWMI